MNYSNCPMLCSLQLNGLVDAIRAMPWELGREFQIMTVSIDPDELPQRAALTKQKYLKLYGRPGAAAGWQFLTGGEKSIKALAEAVGFGYTYLAKQRQFAHPAVLILCTPDGRVWRYLGGVRYEPLTLRLALVETAEGKAGTAFDQVLLYCFHYDENVRPLWPGRLPLAANQRRTDRSRPRRRIGGVLAAGTAQEKAGPRRRRRHNVPARLVASRRRGVLAAAMPGGRILLAPAAGRLGAKFVDGLFFFLLSVSTFFFLLVVTLMGLFVVVYRRRPRTEPRKSPSHNTLLEILWTAIPSAIVAVVFYQGFTDYLELRTPPTGAKEVRVFAKKWSWLFQYPGGLQRSEPARARSTSRSC